jgi:hypothetical protein
MMDGAESRCAKRCSYMFPECEADGTPASECRAYYNHCVEECTVTWPEQELSVPV